MTPTANYRDRTPFDALGDGQAAAMAQRWVAYGHPHAVDWAAAAATFGGGELRFLARQRDFEALDGLLRAGFPPSAFAEAAARDAMNSCAFAMYFLDRIDLSGNPEHLAAALFGACERRVSVSLVPVVRRLLALGADPNRAHGVYGESGTPFSAAIGSFWLSTEVLEVLLGAGARPTAGCLERAVRACDARHIPVVALLLAHGAPIHTVGPLIEAGKAAKQKSKQEAARAFEALVNSAREGR